MRNLIIFTFLLLLVQQTRATEVYAQNSSQGEIILQIHKVEYDDLDRLSLTNRNNIEMELDCEKNEYNRFNKSYILYRNIYGVDVDNFILDAKSCDYIKKFLTLTFEAISEEFPLEIKLDIPSKSVTQVILPPLDPYWDGGLKEKKSAKVLNVKSIRD